MQTIAQQSTRGKIVLDLLSNHHIKIEKLRDLQIDLLWLQDNVSSVQMINLEEMSK